MNVKARMGPTRILQKMPCCIVYNLTRIIDYVNLITLSLEKEINLSKE